MIASRAAVVRETEAWIGTKYVFGQCCRGAGADCATFILGVYRNVGIFKSEDIEVYAADWFQHTMTERYLLWVMRHAHKIAEAKCTASLKILPGDIVLTRVARSRRYNHGGIVIDWPQIIHCLHPEVKRADASRDPLWFMREVVAFDPWEKLRASGFEPAV